MLDAARGNGFEINEVLVDTGYLKRTFNRIQAQATEATFEAQPKMA